MSSIDQAFVKAFSRRNRGTNSPEAPVELPPTEPVSSEEVGSLKLDPSVSSSASVWVDPIENEIARADQSDTVRKPHVAQSSRAAEKPAQQEGKAAGSHPIDERLQSLQHTAYASAEISNEVAESLRVPVIGDDEIPVTRDAPAIVETRIDPPVQKVPAPPTTKTPHVSSATAPSAPPEVEVAPEVETVETDTVETKTQGTAETVPVKKETITKTTRTDQVVPPAPESTAQTVVPTEPAVVPREPAVVPTEPAVAVPFRAAWEVDVFEIPNEVADLFFEGQLFQQIAERMLDAVATGLTNMLVTSVQRGEGRSSVAIGMAMAAAAAGLRVALVDGDADHPSLADDLRLDLPHGWIEATRNGLPVKEVAVHAVEDGVTLFPLVPASHNGDVATAKESSQLLQMLQDRFDLVIVDGPAADSGKAESWAESFDSAIIICDPSRTNPAAVESFASSLAAAGIQGIGMVENFV